LNVGGTIVNQGAQAVMSAQTLNVFSNAGTIVNSGLMQAVGSLNLSGNALSDLKVECLKGVIKVLAGDINVRDSHYDGAFSTSLLGGDWLSQNLNVHGGQGALQVNVGDLTGQFNSEGTFASLYANTPVLTLGSSCITGDPTFVNTQVGGSIVITGVNTFSQRVAILANGNITTAGGGQIVAHGADVTIIAGAKTATTGATSTGVPGTQSTQAVTVTLDPSVSNGGDINFSSGAAVTVIDTSTAGDGSNAGSVTL